MPTPDGVYTTPVTSDTSKHPTFRHEVHSLEHGRVELHVQAQSAGANAQAPLKGLFDQDAHRDAAVSRPRHAVRGRRHGLEDISRAAPRHNPVAST